MKFSITRRITRTLLGSGLLVTGLLVGPLTALTAGASFTTCGSDPVVYLSNGQTLTLTATINDAASDVQHITYIIHGPWGTRVNQVVYDNSPLSSVETVQYSADNNWNTFDATTLVTTGATNVSVTVQATLSVWGRSSSTSVTGTSGTAVLTHLFWRQDD